MSFTQIIYLPFQYIMKFCLLISANYYVWALFFFALIIQIILIPLAIKQQKSQIKQRKLQPKEMAIRKKYAGRTDKATQQKVSMEIQEMYQQEGHSMFSGCLPLLIQLPIIFILFAIVRNPITNFSDYSDQKDKLYQHAIDTVELYKDESLYEISEGTSFEDYKNSLTQYQIKNLYAKEEESDGVKTYRYNASAAQNNELDLIKIILDGNEHFEAFAKESGITLKENDIKQVSSYEGFENIEEKLPKFGFFGVNLLETPSFGKFNWLLLIPLLVFLSSFLSGKLAKRYNGSAASAANGQAAPGTGVMMEWGMPAMSAIFAFSFVGAIGVYWIWRTVVGMLQTVLMNKFLPLPVISPEEIKAYEKEIKAAKKKKVIMIEVDEDDDSFNELEIKEREKLTSGKSGSNKNQSGKKKPELKPSANKTYKIGGIEMLAAEEIIPVNDTEPDADEDTATEEENS